MQTKYLAHHILPCYLKYFTLKKRFIEYYVVKSVTEKATVENIDRRIILIDINITNNLIYNNN